MGRPQAILLISILAISYLPVEGKIMTTCEAVRELLKAKFSKTFMSNWICLMKHESGMNTNLITGPKPPIASYSYGIFQINSHRWCGRGYVGGLCNSRCEKFADDNIQDDAVCANRIFNQEGFKWWQGWVRNCKGKQVPDVSHCWRSKRMAEQE